MQISDVMARRLGDTTLSANQKAAKDIGIHINDIKAFMEKREILKNKKQPPTSSLGHFNFLSPDLVKLDKKGRFFDRYSGNINYLKYLYEHYGEEMIDAYAARNYSPGKLLERMWDGEYAGKWLDAAIRSGVNTNDNELLVMVD